MDKSRVEETHNPTFVAFVSCAGAADSEIRNPEAKGQTLNFIFHKSATDQINEICIFILGHEGFLVVANNNNQFRIINPETLVCRYTLRISQDFLSVSEN